MYGTIEGFRDYADARDYPIPVAAEGDEVAAALLVASDWIDGKYGPTFRAGGTFKTGGRDQVREWPRSGYVDQYGYALPSDQVPREVISATYEAAYRQLVRPGSLNTDFTLAKSYKSVSIDGAVSVTYAGASSASDAQLIIPIVGQILAPLLNSLFALSGNGLVGSAYRT